MRYIVADALRELKENLRSLRKETEKVDNINEVAGTAVLPDYTLTLPPPLPFSNARWRTLVLYKRVFEELSEEFGLRIGLSTHEIKNGHTEVMIVYKGKGEPLVDVDPTLNKTAKDKAVATTTMGESGGTRPTF